MGRQKRDHRITLDRALTDREYSIRKAAIAHSDGERPSFPDPKEPNPVEKKYLAAIDAFKDKRPTRRTEKRISSSCWTRVRY